MCCASSPPTSSPSPLRAVRGLWLTAKAGRLAARASSTILRKRSAKSATPSATPNSAASKWKLNETTSPDGWKTRRGLILSASLWPFLLSGCGGSIPYSNPAEDFPPSLTRPCQKPVVLPDTALNDQQVEVFWGRDRKSLLDCGGRFEVVAGRPPNGK